MTSNLKKKTFCQVCGNIKLVEGMNLGPLPLPDQLLPIGSDDVCPKYPTRVMWCDVCKTAHLQEVVPNHIVFPAEYHYRAANTKDVLDGMEGFVTSVKTRIYLPGLRVLDIGCNDGSLLDAFQRAGARTYGIEPTDAVREAGAKGHVVWQDYLSVPVARDFVFTYGHPDIITFVNVFAHIEDFQSLMRSMCILLGPKTRLIIENHYMGSVLDRNQFDTFYHEHPRTYSQTSFGYIAKDLGMHISHTEFPARYGGNIRVFMSPGVRFGERVAVEKDFGDRLRNLAVNVDKWRQSKRALLRPHFPIPAAAMPGRATILFNLLGLDADEVTGVFEVPQSKKIGYYVPGTRIPILSDANFPWETYQGPVLNMGWHIPAEIQKNWEAKGFKGTFIQAIDPGDFR